MVLTSVLFIGHLRPTIGVQLLPISPYPHPIISKTNLIPQCSLQAPPRAWGAIAGPKPMVITLAQFLIIQVPLTLPPCSNMFLVIRLPKPTLMPKMWHLSRQGIRISKALPWGLVTMVKLFTCGHPTPEPQMIGAKNSSFMALTVQRHAMITLYFSAQITGGFALQAQQVTRLITLQ